MSLKEYLISAPVLHFPSFDLPFVLDTDASNAGLGAVLSQNVHGTECDLHTVISWLTSDLVPPDFPKQSSYTVHTLWNQRNSLVLDQGVLFKRWEDIPNGGHQPTLQLLVPCKQIPSILEALHDHAMAGHLGIAKTLKKIQQRFYWPGQRRMVEDWCKACAARKSQPKPRRAPLQSEGSGLPMQRIAMDILGPLPEPEQQNKYILVISDYFTKWTESFPMKNMEAKTVAEQLISNFICRLGLPYYIHTDQGRNFESSLISEMSFTRYDKDTNYSLSSTIRWVSRAI